MSFDEESMKFIALLLKSLNVCKVIAVCVHLKLNPIRLSTDERNPEMNPFYSMVSLKP